MCATSWTSTVPSTSADADPSAVTVLRETDVVKAAVGRWFARSVPDPIE